MGDKIRLHVKGLTYSDRPSGAYALLLESEEDKRKLPIVIGAFEAQSIAIALDKMTRPPRPMTHDLFAAVMESHQIDLTEVVIRDFQDGVFFALLVFQRGGGHTYNRCAALRRYCAGFACRLPHLCRTKCHGQGGPCGG